MSVARLMRNIAIVAVLLVLVALAGNFFFQFSLYRMVVIELAAILLYGGVVWVKGYLRKKRRYRKIQAENRTSILQSEQVQGYQVCNAADNENDDHPTGLITSCGALVITKRNPMGDEYYAGFQLDDGERIELRLAGAQYGLIIEGDLGMLSFRNGWVIAFDRNGAVKRKA